MLNIVIPASGLGSRFLPNYKMPKPMIEIAPNLMMIQMVIQNIGLDGNYIFIIQKEHAEKYHFDKILKLLSPNCTIVITNGVTEGAACSVLLAREHIDNNNPLLIANSDQWLDWNSLDFIMKVLNGNADASIVTFKAVSSRWSFVQSDNNGKITRVVEKVPISDRASAGVYWMARGSDFCKYADSMIAANKRVNGEYYVCPVFQEFIDDGKLVKEYPISQCIGVGVPEDLEMFWRMGIKV